MSVVVSRKVTCMRPVGDEEKLGRLEKSRLGGSRGGVRDARGKNHQRASGLFEKEEMERRVREKETDEAVPRRHLASERRISPNRHEYDRPLHRGQ